MLGYKTTGNKSIIFQDGGKWQIHGSVSHVIDCRDVSGFVKPPFVSIDFCPILDFFLSAF